MRIQQNAFAPCKCRQPTGKLTDGCGLGWPLPQTRLEESQQTSTSMHSLRRLSRTWQQAASRVVARLSFSTALRPAAGELATASMAGGEAPQGVMSAAKARKHVGGGSLARMMRKGNAVHPGGR